MGRRARLLVPALALALVLGFGASGAYAAVWSSTDKFGSWSSGGLNFVTNSYSASVS